MKLFCKVDPSELRSRRLYPVARAWSPTCLAQWLQRRQITSAPFLAADLGKCGGAGTSRPWRGRGPSRRPSTTTAALWIGSPGAPTQTLHLVAMSPVSPLPSSSGIQLAASGHPVVHPGVWFARRAKCRWERRCPVFLASLRFKPGILHKAVFGSVRAGKATEGGGRVDELPSLTNPRQSLTSIHSRFPSALYLEAKRRLRAGLAMPVLMVYGGNDSALGPELVKARANLTLLHAIID